MAHHESHQDDHTVKKNAVMSAFSLFFQSGYSAVLGLIANLVLTILLSPAIFGIYITVLSIISLLNYFSDIGLAASLIQKKEISDDDIRTTFTVQQMLIIIIVTIGFIATTFIKNFYKLPEAGVHLYWALLTSFFISSLKTIPSVFLERKIQFHKIVFVQVLENTVFYLAVIFGALGGLQLTSFTVAVLIRAVIGLIAIYRISPWRPTAGISQPSLKHLLSFGLPFQGSSFLALFKDDLIILYLSKMLGFEGVGYIGWAKKWAEAPIRIIMDNITRVIFPLIARYQEDKGRIGQLIQKILYYQSAILIPTLFGAILLMGTVVEIIPKYGKWSSALPLFYVFCISSLIVSFTSPFVNLLNALGKAKITFSLMVFWTIVIWLLTPVFIDYFDYYGYALAHLSTSCATLVVLFIVRRYISFSIIKASYRFFVSALFMVITISVLKIVFPNPSIIHLILYGSAGVLTYALSLLFIFRLDIKAELNTFRTRKIV